MTVIEPTGRCLFLGVVRFSLVAALAWGLMGCAQQTPPLQPAQAALAPSNAPTVAPQGTLATASPTGNTARLPVSPAPETAQSSATRSLPANTNLFTKGPYLQAPGADSMTIMWESLENGPAVVFYGRDGQMNQRIAAPDPRELCLKIPPPRPARSGATNQAGTTNQAGVVSTNLSGSSPTNATVLAATNLPSKVICYYLYQVALARLQPGTAYTYAVEQAGETSPPRTFRTLPEQKDKVTFIAYGDTRTHPAVHQAIARNFKRFNPEFILHTGDLVEKGEQYNLWAKEFFAPLRGVIDEIPLYAAVGNHEENGTNYLTQLHLPDKQRWYSFDAGPVHFLALDYHYTKTNQAQFQFATRDLMQSQAPWKVVFLHYPMFNVGGHDTAWGHECYLPLFHQAKVDMVIAGHSHIYERFKPIGSTDDASGWPIVHITTGGGGAPLDTSPTHSSLAVHARTNHFLVLEATADTLRGRAFTTNCSLLDEFELHKTNGAYSPQYLTGVYSESLLQAVFDVGGDLVGKFLAVPTPEQAQDVKLTIHKARSTAKPVELEITLTTNSAKYYVMDNAPLRVLTPAGKEGDKEIVASIRPNGWKPIKLDAGREMIPDLILNARILSPEGDTVVRGPRIRISSTVDFPLSEAAEKRDLDKPALNGSNRTQTAASPKLDGKAVN